MEQIRVTNIRTITVVFILFIMISSGAYGIEDMISESGPGMTIVLLIVLAIFWGMPYGLVCAEMGARYPQEGGFYVWVKENLGRYWGFQAGWWYYLMSIVDTAVYLVLAMGYINSFLDLSPLHEWLLSLVFIVLFAYLNIIGLEVVGYISLVFTVVILVPFIAVTAVGFTHMTVNPFQPFLADGESAFGSLGLALMIGMWMFSGYESVSTMAGEIEGAQKKIPKALFIVMPFVTLSYVLPVVACLGAYGNWSEWSTEGGISFIEAGAAIGGGFLGVLFLVSAVVSNLGLFNDYIASVTRVPMVMAEDGMLPGFFRKLHPRYKTPAASIIFMCAVMALVSLGTFEALIAIDVFLYIFCLMLIFVSGAVMRFREKNPAVRFLLPIGNKMYVFMLIFPFFVCIMALVTSEIGDIVFGIIALFSGPLAYQVFGRKKIVSEMAASDGGS